MSATVSVPIQPSVLAWARAESGYAVDRVASRLQVKPEKVEAWERGERTPTLRQVQELASAAKLKQAGGMNGRRVAGMAIE